jgi:Na+-translocating ferredoxin:NAD+ oxidoreductase RnfD subunit
MRNTTTRAQAIRAERAAPLPGFDRLRQFLRTPKGALLAIFLGLFALGATAVGWPIAVPHMLAAVLGASLTELAVSRFDRRPLAWPSSAILSGMIVGFVLGPATPHVVAAAVGILATLGKHLFATERWHIFNPAALALLVSVPLFGTGQSWWGALPDLSWPFVFVLLAGGAFIVDRINKFPLVLSFLGASFALLAAPGRIDPLIAAELFRAPFVQAALFLALFMLTDPPTAPARYTEQVAIGVVVAVASVAAEVLGAGQAYLLVGLLIGNVALAVRRWLSQRRVRPGAQRSVGSTQRLALAPRDGVRADTRRIVVGRARDQSWSEDAQDSEHPIVGPHMHHAYSKNRDQAHAREYRTVEPAKVAAASAGGVHRSAAHVACVMPPRALKEPS